MMQLARRASLIVLLLLASVGTASAECTCVSLRTFTSEERGRFEEQYGIEWWKVIGLIPGPAQPGDWPSGTGATVPGWSTCRSSSGTFDLAWPISNRLARPTRSPTRPTGADPTAGNAAWSWQMAAPTRTRCRRQRADLLHAAARAGQLGGVEASGRPRIRGLRVEGRAQRERGRPHDGAVESQAVRHWHERMLEAVACRRMFGYWRYSASASIIIPANTAGS
jgi:hypothetical protein